MVDRGDEKGLVRGTLSRAWKNLTWILERWSRLLWPVLTYEAWFSILAVSVMVPATAWLMNRLVAASGGVAVGNTEMVGFFMSVPGLVFLLLAVGSAVTFQYAEYSGLLVILRAFSHDLEQDISDGLWHNLSHMPGLALLGVYQTLAYAIGIVLWLGGCLLIKSHWLSAHDINYYLSRQPREWFVALVVGGLWTLPWLVAAVALFVRWIHAVPLMVFEQRSARSALAVSWQRSRGSVWQWVMILVTWNVITIGAFFALGALIRWISAGFLGTSLGNLNWTLAVVLTSLGAIGLVGLVGLFIYKLGLALLVLVAYEVEIPPDQEPIPPLIPKWLEHLRPRSARVTAWALAIAVLIAGLFWVNEFVDQIIPSDSPQITAHRGSSHAAPENTLSALRQAIEDGADYAEIDVQTTADGAVILHHDADFMRVAADPRKVEELALGEVQTLDVGRWFSEEFSGERVATLQEAIAVCRGRLRLNIELKYNRTDPELAGRVGEILRREGFTDQCIVMSLNWGPLQEFRAQFPEVPIGHIVFRSLGRLASVNTDAVSMNAGQMSAGLVRSIQRRAVRVHVWTVNDVRLALQMIELEVDNLITDRPGDMRRLLDDWEELKDSEKVALQLRRLLLPNEKPVVGEL
jgi:glycerophosphoryl diester phosphodiesterase